MAPRRHEHEDTCHTRGNHSDVVHVSCDGSFKRNVCNSGDHIGGGDDESLELSDEPPRRVPRSGAVEAWRGTLPAESCVSLLLAHGAGGSVKKTWPKSILDSSSAITSETYSASGWLAGRLTGLS